MSGFIESLKEFIPFMLQGSVVTVEIFVLTIVLSLPLGLPFAFGENSKFKPLKWLCQAYVGLFRGTPLLLQMLFFYLFFPLILGWQVSAFWSVIIAFVLNYAAYFAEIFRGGINSIDRGQYEAAYSLGFTKGQTMRLIILPQTMTAILPAIMNETITLVKDTALAYTIGVVELMKATNSAVNRLTDVTPFFYAALIYLIMTIILTALSKKLEEKFAF